jgi:hypothetical protein
MRSSMLRLVEVGLLAAILLMAALVLAPWKARPLPGAAASAPAAPSAVPGSQPDSRTVVAAEQLVPLFLGKEPSGATVIARTPPAPVVAPVDATWLRYLGRSSSDDGKSYVYLKDTRSGRVFQVTRGEYLNGWMLSEENDASLVLQNADGTFIVNKR